MTEKELRELWQARSADPRWALLVGFHPVKHALRFGAEVGPLVTDDPGRVLALAGALAADLLPLLRDRLVQVPSATFGELAGGPERTGVLALARRPGAALPADRVAPLVLLEEPRQAGNIGAVIRVAAGLGAAGVLTTGTVDPWHPAVLRGSAGLHFATTVLRVTGGYPAALPGPVFGLDPTGADIRGVDLPGDAVLAFGSERRGLSASLRQRADTLVALPMRPQVSSFNLATSVAMTLYHWVLRSGSRPAAGTLRPRLPG
jgi:RNA methyltransferase, TrmH family